MSSATSCFGMILKTLRTILESSEVFNYAQYFAVVKDIPFFNSLLKKSYNTLELFSFGSISDYFFNMENYLKLSPESITKLRILTLITLADIDEKVDLSFVSLHLITYTKQETLDLLLKACEFGVITCSVDFSTEKVQFFSVRKRNTDIILLERLIKVKSAINEMIVNRSIIFILPLNHEFSDIVQRIVATATHEGEESSRAEAELLEFIKSTGIRQYRMTGAKKSKGESKNEKALDYNEQNNAEEAGYDADEELEKDEDNVIKEEKQKKPKKED